MFIEVPDQRILRGVAATLSFTNTDAEGREEAASGTVTVGVDDANGDEVLASGTATSGTNPYTVALPVAKTATLELLTATWMDDGDSSAHETKVEICGGHYFTLADIRDFDKKVFGDGAKYDDDLLVSRRIEAEDECEYICGVAFVPRYRRVVLDGTGEQELILPDRRLRTIRSVTVDGTAYTASELDDLAVDTDFRIRRPDGQVFSEGNRNVVVEYEHGNDRPPPLLKQAVKTRFRDLITGTKAGPHERATSVSVTEVGTFELDKPGRYRTGLVEVDAVYQKYSERTDGDGEVAAASRGFDYDPQYTSMFHGGRR